MTWNLSASAVKVGRLITLAFVLSSWSCSYALRPPEITAGRGFHEEHLPRIHSGMAASEVQQLLGEPLEVRKSGSAETWRYFVRSVQGESVRLLGIIPFPGPKWTGMREAIITIVDGSVVDIRVRREPTSGPKNRRRAEKHFVLKATTEGPAGVSKTLSARG